VSKYVNRHTVGIWESNSTPGVTESTRDNTKFDVYCALPPLLPNAFTVTNEAFRDVLEELLTMILEEKGPKDVLFQQDGGTNSAFSCCIPCRISWIESLHTSGLAQVVLSHDHLILLTLHHFIYSSRGILKFCLLSTTANHSAGNCLAVAVYCGCNCTGDVYRCAN